MKKGVVCFSTFTLFLLVLLSSGIFAAPPIQGTCSIVIPSECISTAGNYRIMGLSSATNAHAEFPYSTYPYVLCCGFGTGSTTCTSTPSNKILGLSSATNSHAEIPSLITYTTPVCYEDLECKDSTSNCGTVGSPVETYKLNFSSLSSTTNAHVGAINDFPIKICCKSLRFLSNCKIISASWDQAEANDQVSVSLTVTGSGTECDGQTINVEVIEAVESNATSVSFTGNTASSVWTAEWQSAGIPIIGGDKSYYFNASVDVTLNYVGKSMKSSNSLIVRNTNPIEDCAAIGSCSGYTEPNECNSDTPCNVADAEGISMAIPCGDGTTICSCSWDSSSGICGFGWGVIEPGLCNAGSTLCRDISAGVDYCFPGSVCPIGDESSCNSNSICNSGEGCTCADCNGQQDSCVSGSTCSGGMCSGTAPASVNCTYGYTLCRVAGTNYCYPGDECPAGQNPIDDIDGICEPGEGCLSPNDCGDGDRDSCVSETYCLSGKCGSIENPVSLDLFGGCKITQTIEKDCDVDPVGYKIISWTGTWSDAGDTTSSAYQTCVAGGRASVPCPAQIQLPFFDYYGLAITIAVISLIYISLIFRKKKK